MKKSKFSEAKIVSILKLSYLHDAGFYCRWFDDRFQLKRSPTRKRTRRV